MNTEYRTTLEAEEVATLARLAPAERQILNSCEQIRTLSEICHEVPVNGFSLCKQFWALLVVGALMKA